MVLLCIEYVLVIDDPCHCFMHGSCCPCHKISYAYFPNLEDGWAGWAELREERQECGQQTSVHLIRRESAENGKSFFLQIILTTLFTLPVMAILLDNFKKKTETTNGPHVVVTQSKYGQIQYDMDHNYSIDRLHSTLKSSENHQWSSMIRSQTKREIYTTLDRSLTRFV